MKRVSKIVMACLAFQVLLTSLLKAQEFSFSGYADFYYSYDFVDPQNNQKQYVTQAARHNEFNLNLGFVQANYAAENLRGTLALQVGTYPSTNYGAEPNAFAQLIQNASVGVRLGEKTWIDAGIMGGHFGYEGLLSMENELYTQALATEYTPYYQTGVQLSTQITDQISMRAVLLNGWQNIYETNDGKSVGIGLDYALNENWSFSYGNYLGNDPVGGQDRLRFHHNIYAVYEKDAYRSAFVIDYMLEGLNVDLPNNTNLLFVTWIHQYQLNDNWLLAGRIEYVEDPTNVLFASPTGNFQTNITTIALRRVITANSMASLELKQYFGNEDIWINDDLSLSANNSMVTAGISMRFP